jgi:protein deglycase
MKTVLVPLAQGCEELEAVTIIDLLRRAEVQVVTASLDNERTITASRGVVLVADHTLEQLLAQSFDLIVLPGGAGGGGADLLQQDLRIQSLLQKQLSQGRFVAAICAAPKVLLSAGVLDGKRITAYPGVLSPNASFILDELTDVIQDGQIITSRGPGTAMDFALTLIELLTGKEKRNFVEKGLVR